MNPKKGSEVSYLQIYKCSGIFSILGIRHDSHILHITRAVGAILVLLFVPVCGVAMMIKGNQQAAYCQISQRIQNLRNNRNTTSHAN